LLDDPSLAKTIHDIGAASEPSPLLGPVPANREPQEPGRPPSRAEIGTLGPDVRFDLPTVVGNLARTRVTQSLGPHRDALAQCMRDHSRVSTQITLRFIVAPDGTIQRVEVLERIKSALRRCLERVARTVRFDASGGGGIVMVKQIIRRVR